MNNGSQSDVAERTETEFASWPYVWIDDDAYHLRGSAKGVLKLSDGRPAARAAVFLGDNRSQVETVRQGTGYYYVAYADKNGRFQINNVHAGTYGLYAGSNGSSIADVSSTFQRNDVEIQNDQTTDLGTLTWGVSERNQLFRIGAFDRTAYEFKVGVESRAYGLTESCPADLTYKVGESKANDWCFAQTKVGNWTIVFPIKTTSTASTAKLIVSVAGYATYASPYIWANGQRIGNITAEVGVTNDGSVYRSCTVAGDYRYLEFPFDADVLRKDADNEVVFQLYENTGE